MKHRSRFFLISFAIVLGVAATAQAQSLGFLDALKQAFANGPDLATSQTTFANAKADLLAKEADPSTLIVPLSQAKQSASLEAARVEAKKLEVAQSVGANYIALFEAQENLKILEAQLALDARSLEIAKAKLAAKNGTTLDVAKAENAVSVSKQNLSDAKANLPILSNKLEPLLGLALNANLVATALPVLKPSKINLTELEKTLIMRLPSVLQASQSVDLNQLNVQLADNDYTPTATLRDAKSNLQNASRNLETVRKNAVTNLRDAARGLDNAAEKIRIANKDYDNATEALGQDQTKFKSGTISRFALQQSELAALRAKYSYSQTNNAYFKALLQLSVAAGQDMTGFVDKAGPS